MSNIIPFQSVAPAGLDFSIATIEPQQPTAEDLRWAAEVAQQMTDRGIELVTAYHNGRRMVLHLERDPRLQNARGSMIRRQPAPGGIERIYAAQHLGMQLQWTVFEPAAEEVVNG
jgi:hypothetical protein